ncbi:MAG TPA: peptidase S8 [Bacteroidetes bacterium]|jgi:hypothetical protein|nr:peptidase S8 [Bacteroidota bacterium]
MKAMISILLLCVVHQGGSQTVYRLQPDTKGNQIELTVANESIAAIAERVEIRPDKHPTAIVFTSAPDQIAAIASSKQAVVTFTFDVGRVATTNKRDTLEFLITDKSGTGWKKTIIVSYAGPTTFELDQNFPNPFNPTTQIQYQLPVESRVTLKVFDLLGREVATLVNDARPAGYHDAQWEAVSVASGVYFYRFEAQPLNGGQGFQSIKKLMVVK